IVDGAPGLEAALVSLWGEDLPIQCCTVGLLKKPSLPDSVRLSGVRWESAAARFEGARAA
ncbi:hypothetical protein, partial [Amaricoccus solimangrovi]|uniref:hypothetical protein n=1 Tax=Amaricoccus solimangrovi TaxID=2589815 RepID=UPI001AEF2AD8